MEETKYEIHKMRMSDYKTWALRGSYDDYEAAKIRCDALNQRELDATGPVYDYYPVPVIGKGRGKR